MKQARQVELPEEGVLSEEVYRDLSDHAFNSSLWYVSTFARNSKQVKDKLLRKGYRDEVFTVEREDGSTFTVNFLDEVLAKLEEAAVLDDRGYAESLLANKKAQGYGASRIRQELRFKGVDPSLIEELLEEEDDFEELRKYLRGLLRSSVFKKMEDPRERRMKLTRKLASRGFSFNDIGEVLQEEEFEGYLP